MTISKSMTLLQNTEKRLGVKSKSLRAHRFDSRTAFILVVALIALGSIVLLPYFHQYAFAVIAACLIAIFDELLTP